MKYLTLSEIKKQCNIDPQWDGDDEFLVMVGDSAEDITAQLIDCDLDEIVAKYGEIPDGIRHAMRMLVDFYYSIYRGSAHEENIDIPNAVKCLTMLYRNFN